MSLHSDTAEGPELVLAVSAARSGSTMLRLLLDAHPDIGCPAEAGIPGLVDHLVHTWWSVNADFTVSDGHDPDATISRELWLARLDELPAGAREAILHAARAPMAYYCSRAGKRIYCDKSIESVHHLGVTGALFGKLRSVLLFRHVMDTVASGLEASPWGFQAFGYERYVQAWSGNAVAALVNYWLVHVNRALSWEQRHPELCHRVRYEDLVRSPATEMARIYSFLGVEDDPGVLDRAFARDVARGGGDYKASFTDRVHSSSIGHGRRVPVGMIPDGLLQSVNAKLELLGYDPLTAAWNATARVEPSARSTVWNAQLRALMRGARPPRDPVGRFAVVSEDEPELRWVVDPETARIVEGDDEADSVIIGATRDLVVLLTRSENVGVLLRSGRVREFSRGASDARSTRADIAHREMTPVLRAALTMVLDTA